MHRFVLLQPDALKVVGKEMETQTRQTLMSIAAILNAAGADLKDVAKTGSSRQMPSRSDHADPRNPCAVRDDHPPMRLVFLGTEEVAHAPRTHV